MTTIAKLPPPGDQYRRRPRRLRSLNLFPTVVTLANLVCGFAAIHFAMRSMYDFGAGAAAVPAAGLSSNILERMLPSFLSVGAGLIILGMVFDCFDGLIARVTRTTTNFGGQLDSLADIVTFGVAPATLLIAYMTKELAGDRILPSPISEHFLGRLTWIAAAFYVAFAAVRLARFNVEHADVDADYKSFRGLPSPGAAALIAAIIILLDQPYVTVLRAEITRAFPVVAFLLAVLMVSRIPYKRFGRAYLLGRWPFGQFVVLMLLIAAFWSYKAAGIVVAVTWYVLSGPIGAGIRRLRRRNLPQPAAEGPSGESKSTIKNPGRQTTA
jgi:CDP-diacylglycerol---serine O-phosphatidyltransferase